MLVVLVWWEVGTRCKINFEESFVIVSSGKMQKENSLFCLVLGLVPNKSLNRIFASYDLCNLLGYGTNRARWECVSLIERNFDAFFNIFRCTRLCGCDGSTLQIKTTVVSRGGICINSVGKEHFVEDHHGSWQSDIIRWCRTHCFRESDSNLCRIVTDVNRHYRRCNCISCFNNSNINGRVGTDPIATCVTKKCGCNKANKKSWTSEGKR